MRPLRGLAKKAARACGYEITRFPHGDTLGAHLADLFAQLSINCVLDVGAHRGEYGALLREIGYRGRIVSFEPVADTFSALERRRVGDPDWRALRLALGSQPDRVPIHVTRSTLFSSLLVPNAEGVRRFGRSVVVDRIDAVEVARLDRVFDECVAGIHRPCVFLKLDTQGWDLEVLSGTGSRLADIRALQSEISIRPIYANMTSYFDSITRMNGMGFELTGLFPVTRMPDLRLIELDCVMRRP